MKPRRYTFASECEAEQLTSEEQFMAHYISSKRYPLKSLAIDVSQLSVDGSDWLQVIEAKKRKDKIIIRVMTNQQRGINIIIPNILTTLNVKYLDLRFLIRNSEKVLITFPKLYVRASCYEQELYLLAHDFKLINPNEDKPAQPILLI